MRAGWKVTRTWNESVAAGSESTTPLFIATERFDPSDGEGWTKYCEWAKIPALAEVVSLDSHLCPSIVDELLDEDWKHNVQENFRAEYFVHLDYLLGRVSGITRKNVLGVYRNPPTHIEAPPAPGKFEFIGYDLVEDETGVSALTNCGGFPNEFSNDELNKFGLMTSFDRASRTRQLLKDRHPADTHARCELYAVWRLTEN
jgi:hypothetical protein